MNESVQALIADFGRMEAALRGQLLSQAGSAAASVIEKEAKKRAPKRTTNLARSIQQNKVSATPKQAVFDVGPSVAYGRYVEEGTGIHGPERKPIVIRPKNARALRWLNAQGVPVFAKRVESPGQKPQPYMVPAFEAKQGDASETAMVVIFAGVEQVMRA